MRDLEIVTYPEAAALLGMANQTITNAVYRGALTPLPRQKRKPGRLVKKQVELFKGKELSLANLSHQEAVTWHEINRVVNANKRAVKSGNPLAYENVRDTIEVAGDLFDRIADLFLDTVREILLSKDIAPETVVNYIMQSPSFGRISELLGMDTDTMPDETLQAINEKAMQTATRIKSGLENVIKEAIPADSLFHLLFKSPEEIQATMEAMSASIEAASQDAQEHQDINV